MYTRNAKGFSAVLLIVLLLVVGVLAAGGYISWQIYSKSTQPRASLVGAKVKPDLLAFTHRQLPTLYPKVIALDDTIALINGEIDRLAGIAKQYPAQKTLLSEETQRLTTIKSELGEALSSTLAATETIYVTYLMNPSQGLQAIKKERTILRRQPTAALRKHAALYRRLSQSQAKGPLDQFLALVGK
jgi:flagellar basal body-associated protein FliL